MDQKWNKNGTEMAQAASCIWNNTRNKDKEVILLIQRIWGDMGGFPYNMF